MTNSHQYKESYSNVEAIINKHDPVDLVKGGAPENEYSSEINSIINLLDKNLEINVLGQEIYNIFAQSFTAESAGQKDKYLGIAKELKKITLEVDEARR